MIVSEVPSTLGSYLISDDSVGLGCQEAELM
jgi:hypothetical protein